MSSERVPLADLQREATRVNELQGVQAFLVGVLHEVLRSKTLDDARTCAEIALQNIEEHHAGLWSPGPHDDPADWRRR